MYATYGMYGMCGTPTLPHPYTHTPTACWAAAKSPQLLFPSGMECTGPLQNPFIACLKGWTFVDEAHKVNKGSV